MSPLDPSPNPNETLPSEDDIRSSRILIVDDLPQIILLLEHILERAGFHKVLATQDSRDVVDLYHLIRPDLIILDLNMPHLHGFEVLDQLQPEVVKEGFMPILVLTGEQSADAKERALASGASDFLTKPFGQTEALLRIRNLLRTRLLYRGLREQNSNLESLVRERTRALELAQVETLERLAQAVEFHDDATGQHTRRVGETAAEIACALGMAPEEVHLLRLSAPLHDVGKVVVPDAVLRKPGRLTPEEFEVMKTHTTIGAQLLSGGQSEAVRWAERIALSHHERWDGAGYPAGLREDQIPLEARIVALADFYDALSHDRSYRRAWPHEQVRQEILKLRGQHFDPRVVDAFLSTLNPQG